MIQLGYKVHTRERIRLEHTNCPAPEPIEKNHKCTTLFNLYSSDTHCNDNKLFNETKQVPVNIMDDNSDNFIRTECCELKTCSNNNSGDLLAFSSISATNSLNCTINDYFKYPYDCNDNTQEKKVCQLYNTYNDQNSPLAGYSIDIGEIITGQTFTWPSEHNYFNSNTITNSTGDDPYGTSSVYNYICDVLDPENRIHYNNEYLHDGNLSLELLNSNQCYTIQDDDCHIRNRHGDEVPCISYFFHGRDSQYLSNT